METTNIHGSSIDCSSHLITLSLLLLSIMVGNSCNADKTPVIDYNRQGNSRHSGIRLYELKQVGLYSLSGI